MGQRWIIDVLADLRVFAEGNGLPLLAGQLEDIAKTAAAELDAMTQGTPLVVRLDCGATGRISGTAGECGQA